MKKSVGVLIAAMMMAPAPALAAGEAWQLGFTYDCCLINNPYYYSAPEVNQTVIVQTGGGKAAVQAVEEEDDGLQVSSLGVNNSVDGPYIAVRPYSRNHVKYFDGWRPRHQFRRGGRHIRVY